MISKFGAAGGAIFLISSVSAFPYNRNILDQRSLGYDDSLGCSQCLRVGNVFKYDALNTAISARKLIAAGQDYSNNKCYDSNIPVEPEVMLDGTLKSFFFGSTATALVNCPSKADICGSTVSATVANKDAATTDFVVNGGSTKLSGQDQCSFLVTATCDLPYVEVKAASGDFLDSSKIGVLFIEGTEDVTLLSGSPTNGGDAVSGEHGALYPLSDAVLSRGLWQDPEAAAGYFLDQYREDPQITRTESIVPGYLVEECVTNFNAEVKKYTDDMKSYASALSAYFENLTKRGKYWVGLNFPQEAPVEVQDIPAKAYPIAPEPPMPYSMYSIEDLVVANGGYGTLTYGDFKVVVGERKSFGVMGQGTGANKGYMYPVEDTSETAKCTPKHIAISVYPIGPKSYTSTGGLTLTVGAEAASQHTLVVDEINAQPPLRQTTDRDIQSLFRQYDQDQMKTEYLGASGLVFAASASAASVAALYLF